MTSSKMAREEKEARLIWEKHQTDNGFAIPPEAYAAFQTGFYMAWKVILTKKKLYRTFNLRWVEVNPGHLLLKDNDERTIAIMLYTKSPGGQVFKYWLSVSSDYTKTEYNQVVDMNDFRRIMLYYKNTVIEEYTELVYKDIDKDIVNKVNIIHLDET